MQSFIRTLLSNTPQNHFFLHSAAQLKACRQNSWLHNSNVFLNLLDGLPMMMQRNSQAYRSLKREMVMV